MVSDLPHVNTDIHRRSQFLSIMVEWKKRISAACRLYHIFEFHLMFGVVWNHIDIQGATLIKQLIRMTENIHTVTIPPWFRLYWMLQLNSSSTALCILGQRIKPLLDSSDLDFWSSKERTNKKWKQSFIAFALFPEFWILY